MSDEGVGSEGDVIMGIVSEMGISFLEASRWANGIGWVVEVSEVSGVEVKGSEIRVSEMIGSEMGISDMMGPEMGMLEEIGSDIGVSETIGVKTGGRVVVGAEVGILNLDKFSVEGDGGSGKMKSDDLVGE